MATLKEQIEGIVTLAVAAAKTGLGVGAIGNAIRNGEVEGCVFGKTLIVRLADAEDWAANRVDKRSSGRLARVARMDEEIAELVEFSDLSILPARMRKIVEMRFGLNGNSLMTLEEIGNTFSLTRERIRQIERKAIKKLSSADSDGGV